MRLQVQELGGGIPVSYDKRGWSRVALRERGQLHLTAPAVMTCTLADTYYQAVGIYEDGLSLGITTAPDGTMTYTGYGNVMHLVGVSDLSVDRACTITYSLFRNDEIVPGAQTPHGFVSPSKTANISITALMEACATCHLDVRIKSSVAGTVVDIENLSVVVVEV